MSIEDKEAAVLWGVSGLKVNRSNVDKNQHNKDFDETQALSEFERRREAVLIHGGGPRFIFEILEEVRRLDPSFDARIAKYADVALQFVGGDL